MFASKKRIPSTRMSIRISLLFVVFLAVALSGVSATDRCAQYTTCDSCGIAYGYGCGWCSTSNTGGFCASGSNVGPTNRTCLYNNWFPNDSCPDKYCTDFTDCGTCTGSSNCGWCESTNQCMPINPHNGSSPTSGFTCLGSFDATGAQCPNIPVFPSDSSDDTLPAAGIWAIVILVLAGFFAILRFVIYINPRMCVPVLGSRLIAGVLVTHDYSTTAWRAIVFLVASSALVLKFIALIVDQWDAYTDSDSDTLYFGVLNFRESSPLGSVSVNYADACSALSTLIDTGLVDGITWILTMCDTGRAAGILTLGYGITSGLFSFVLVIFSLLSVINASRVASNAVKMWRVAGVASTFSLAAYTVSLSGHLVAHHFLDVLNIGASWYLMLGAFSLDCFLLFLFRRITVFTPNPAYGAAGAPVNMAYQQLNAGPVTTSYAAQPFAVPQGYGAPTQYNPPSYNPHAPYPQPPQQQQMYQPARGSQSGF